MELKQKTSMNRHKPLEWETHIESATQTYSSLLKCYVSNTMSNCLQEKNCLNEKEKRKKVNEIAASWTTARRKQKKKNISSFRRCTLFSDSFLFSFHFSFYISLLNPVPFTSCCFHTFVFEKCLKNQLFSTTTKCQTNETTKWQLSFYLFVFHFPREIFSAKRNKMRKK